jgi:acyl-CoA thioesterase-1
VKDLEILGRVVGWRRVVARVVVAGAAAVAACGAPAVERSADSRNAQATSGPIVRPEQGPRPRIVVLGDSLTAGLGLPVEQAFPSILQSRLDDRGYAFEVVNAGVSGDTTAGGLRRLDWALGGDVKVLIVALGGNDGLRGLPVSEVKQNLQTIVARTRDRRIKVLLVGIEAPPNFGERYTNEFRQVFRDVAREAGVAFVPFLLEGVAGIPALNQADGIHPTAEGARIMANTIWSGLEPLLGSTPSS